MKSDLSEISSACLDPDVELSSIYEFTDCEEVGLCPVNNQSVLPSTAVCVNACCSEITAICVEQISVCVTHFFSLCLV